MIFGRFLSEKVPVQVHIKISTSQNGLGTVSVGSYSSWKFCVKRMEPCLAHGAQNIDSKDRSLALSSRKLESSYDKAVNTEFQLEAAKSPGHSGAIGCPSSICPPDSLAALSKVNHEVILGTSA